MVCISNKDEFQCKSDECIKWTYVCDGISHCSNKADEDCDMCSNDLYICKDSSRINCTLACSTLGYIPCKNYADRKICSSYSKKSNYLKPNNLFKNIENNDLNQVSSSLFSKYGLAGDDGQNLSFLKNIPSNEKFMFSAIGVFVIAFLIISFLLFGIIYKRYKQKKRAFSTRIVNNHQAQNVNNFNINTKIDPLNNSSSKTNSTTSLNHVYFNESNNLIIGDKKTNSLSKTQNKYKLMGSNEILTHPKMRMIDDNELKDSDASEYHMYGEPPPSYKQSQFYPKADLVAQKLKNKNELTVEPLLKICDTNSSQEEISSHIYENIDEINLAEDSKKRLSKRNSDNTSRSLAGNKRAKFQALKKNGSMKLTKKHKETPTDLNNQQSDFNNSLEISFSPSTLSTSSSSTLNKSNQKLKNQKNSPENEHII